MAGAKTVATKTAAKGKSAAKAVKESKAARVTKTIDNAVNTMKQTAIKMKKGCIVAWTTRTRTGEKSYEGVLMSGAQENGRRMVKITTNGKESTMTPKESWLTVKQAAA